jgi:hypothetical protein
MRWHEQFRPADRVDQILYGLVLLAAACFLGYFGIKGAIGFLRGSRAAPSDPLACAIGILGGLGSGYLSVRLLIGWQDDRPLLPNLFLLCAGLGALAGTLWFLILTAQVNESVWSVVTPALVMGSAGVGALVLWWRRTRQG